MCPMLSNPNFLMREVEPKEKHIKNLKKTDILELRCLWAAAMAKKINNLIRVLMYLLKSFSFISFSFVFL